MSTIPGQWSTFNFCFNSYLCFYGKSESTTGIWLLISSKLIDLPCDTVLLLMDLCHDTTVVYVLVFAWLSAGSTLSKQPLITPSIYRLWTIIAFSRQSGSFIKFDSYLTLIYFNSPTLNPVTNGSCFMTSHAHCIGQMALHCGNRSSRGIMEHPISLTPPFPFQKSFHWQAVNFAYLSLPASTAQP